MPTISISEDQFDSEVLQASEPVLVDFWAPWCGPCKFLAPILDELSGDYEGRVKIVKVDIDQNPGLAGKFSVVSIPTMLLFKGGEVCGQFVGMKDKGFLSGQLDGLLA